MKMISVNDLKSIAKEMEDLRARNKYLEEENKKIAQDYITMGDSNFERGCQNRRLISALDSVKPILVKLSSVKDAEPVTMSELLQANTNINLALSRISPEILKHYKLADSIVEKALIFNDGDRMGTLLALLNACRMYKIHIETYPTL